MLDNKNQKNLLIIWKKCLLSLKKNYPKQFNTWIKPIQIEDKKKYINLLVPNQFVKNEIKENFFSEIKKTIKHLSNNSINVIRLKIGTKKINESIKKINFFKYKKKIFNSFSYLNNFNKKFTFANFIEGNSNLLAKSIAMKVSLLPGKKYNPLLIYGKTGLGKTHLIHSIGNKILKNNPQYRILYLHSENFVFNMIRSIKEKTIIEFKNFYRSLNGLFLEDIQFFANKKYSQNEFFHTFNTLLEQQQQVVLTSNLSPKIITGLTEQLKSKLNYGLTVKIEPPNFNTRILILIEKAKQLNINLPKKVIYFIANHINSNVLELEEALKNIAENSIFTKKKIDIKLTKNSLKNLIFMKKKSIDIDTIKKVVMKYYNIQTKEFLSKKRYTHLVKSRQMAMLLIRKLTDLSFYNISTIFNKKDHTTALYAYKKMRNLIQLNDNFSKDYKKILEIILSKYNH
ncbi:chromosomal replication initiator protein DnaA [Candidatus Legionella polyplacis]|uniref:chromosomal replication initiator protein DnaA n=1 Tax=Candidatus Legionella polyplacis TaxID=2005262 RepID=UPI000C1E4C0E|nr:chromosomal replication initiator protein DnaA [Candidatus Legionella polyplacis]ATW01900.1 chromosomal replication initiator protein DnaA [Candidatus Legionella polyplacis]